MVKDGRNDHWYLERARQILTDKLAWGEVEDWTSEDFNNLSEAILVETNLSLSVTTLKRLLGRVNYNATPHPTTLNALVQFIGYDNWRVFKQALSHPSPVEAPVSIEKKVAVKATVLKAIYWMTSMLLILGAIFIFLSLKKKDTTEAVHLANIKDKVSFSSKPLSIGLPNTVIFNYDVRDVPGKTFEIQQSWDASKRFSIDPNQQEVTATYYYPGFYKAKMVIDGQIIREHDLFITTNGWMAAFEENPLPRYVLEEEWQQKPYLSLHPSMIAQQHEAEKIPFLAYYLVQDFGDLQSADFTMETSIRPTFRNGKAPCQFFRLIINCTDGFFSIPMSIAGCVGEISARFNDLVFDGKQKDLSGLAYQEGDWQQLHLEVINQHVRLKMNNKVVLTGIFAENAGRVVGFSYKFQGAGEVDHLKVWNRNQDLILNEIFE